MDQFTSGDGRNPMCNQLERVSPIHKNVLSVRNSRDFSDSRRVFPTNTDLYELVHSQGKVLNSQYKGNLLPNSQYKGKLILNSQYSGMVGGYSLP